MDRIISLANGSSSSLYGCIGCAVKDMIISKFPKDYFKYTSVSSELATRNIRRSFGGNNSKTEIVKRVKPLLIIQPTYSVMDQDGPLQNIPLTKNFDDLQYRVDKRYLFEIIHDSKYGYNLKFKLNRDRIEFDVTVTTDTLHQQLDIYRTILNQIIWDRSYAYRIALESVIPKKMVAIMSKYCNMDLEENEEYIPMMLKRLNSCSGYPITYKMRNASATDEWFMYYTHNVIMTFTDLSIESGNKKNMADESYNITFRVTAEFNMPGVFMIDGNNDKTSGVDITLKTKEYQEENDAYFPLYTVSNLYSRFPTELNGMQLYGTTIFQTTAEPNQLEDRIDITCVLDNDHIRVIRAHKAWNMNPNTLLNFYILKDGTILEYGKDYEIDWNTLQIVVKTIDNTATYRLIMYFNYATVNEILNNTSYDRNYDVDKIKENKFPDQGIEEDVVFIHSSITDKEQKSDKIYDTGMVPEMDYRPSWIVELFRSDRYCAGEEHGTLDIDLDIILFKNKVIINNDSDRFRQMSDKMYLKDWVDPNNKDPIILEDDPTYCAGQEHKKVDYDSILYNNVVFINNDLDNYHRPATNIYLKGYASSTKLDDPTTIILEDDPTYCADDEHQYVDAELIIDKDTVIVRNDKDNFKLRSPDIYLPGKVPHDDIDDPNNVILEDDPTYCGESHEISLDEISIFGISEDSTNADIHNSVVSTKKRFSSSI